MLATLHRHRGRGEAELFRKVDDLRCVIICHQDIAFYLCKITEESSVIDVPVTVEATSGDGVRGINKEDGVRLICVPLDCRERILAAEGAAISDGRNGPDAFCECFGIPTRADASAILTGLCEARPGCHDAAVLNPVA